MTPNEVAKTVVDGAMRVHMELGPGLLESAYEAVLAYELEKRGLRVQRQVPFGIAYDGLTVAEAFRADLVVEEQVIVELKSLESVHPVHKKQVLTYLRFSGMRLGLLINFGARLLRNGIFRFVNGLEEELPKDSALHAAGDGDGLAADVARERG
jgi:GxxExxY protein